MDLMPRSELMNWLLRAGGEKHAMMKEAQL
jgi:hypothetical protein